MGHDDYRRDSGDNISTRLTYLLIGGGIGAVIALLFAPKSGHELRGDIADATRKGIDKSREAAQQLGDRAGEYYQQGRERAGEYYEATRDRASELYSQAAEKVGEVAQTAREAASRQTNTVAAAIAIAGMYLRKPGKYGYENPSKKISGDAPSPAASAPPAKTTSEPAIAYQLLPVMRAINQKAASAARKPARAPDKVIAHGVPMPSMRAGIAMEYGAANCIEKSDSGCGVAGDSSRPE